MNRLQEIMQRIGSRPALIRMASVADYFGDSAPYRVEERVAIIDIVGPLSNAVWSWRGTTYGEIQDQVNIASADPNVRGILLNVNSPGGETDNAFETADLIAAIEKPCYAVCNTSAYSAAYLLASQADKVYCVPTSGGAGSIGVYCAHFDYSALLKKEGVKITLISAGEGKTDGNPYEPLSEAAYESLKAEIDRLYGEFIGGVAKGRGMNPTTLVKMGAKCFEGAPAAIAAGLADASGDLPTAWVDLCTEIQRPKMPVMAAAKPTSVASATETEESKRMAEEKKPAPADATQPAAADVEAQLMQARESGRAETAAIVELCAIAGKPGLASKFIGEKLTREQVSAELLKQRAAESGTEIASHILPDAGTGTEARPSQSAVVKACEARAAEAKGGK